MRRSDGRSSDRRRLPKTSVRLLLSHFYFLVSRSVLERGPLGDDGEEGSGGAARAVAAGLPLAHRLLPRAELCRQLFLAQLHVPPKGAYGGGIPTGGPFWLPFHDAAKRTRFRVSRQAARNRA